MASGFSKSVGNALMAWTDIASTVVQISSDYTLTNTISADFAIDLARLTGTAFTAGWPNLRVEKSYATSGTDAWRVSAGGIFQPAVGASIASTTLNGATSAGASTFVVTSATNIAVGDLLFLGDTSTANYEVCRVKAVSSTTITPEEVLTYAHANAALVTDQAESYTCMLNVEGVKRVRLVVDNAGSGQGIKVRGIINTCDSVVTL